MDIEDPKVFEKEKGAPIKESQMLTFRQKKKILCKPEYQEFQGELVPSWCKKFDNICSSKTCKLGEPDEKQGATMTIKEAYDKGFRDCLGYDLGVVINPKILMETVLERLGNNAVKHSYDPPKEEDGDESKELYPNAR